MSRRALEGIKVVEYATMVSGPYCGKMLADRGADVIKVEPPEGDPSRRCGPFPKDGKHPEKSALFLYANTSKRGITLDIENPEGLGPLKNSSSGPTFSSIISLWVFSIIWALVGMICTD